jgi:TonB-dependent SusC/RagA subfamily outer membrane receptor
MRKAIIITLIILYKSTSGMAQKSNLDSLIKISTKLPTILKFGNNEVQMNPINSVPVRNYCGCGGKGGPPPLYILDGKEMTEDSMKNIDPQAIESISVVKDATSAKQYGDKGKNGVIIITMKKVL